MTEQPTAAVNPLAGIEFTGPELPPSMMIVDAVVLARVQNIETGRSQVVGFRSKGIDDVTETGMLHIAGIKDRMAWESVYGDEDDD